MGPNWLAIRVGYKPQQFHLAEKSSTTYPDWEYPKPVLARQVLRESVSLGIPTEDELDFPDRKCPG